MFAVISRAALDGSASQTRFLSLHKTPEAAAVAAAARPDVDPSVGCARLAHNQASETALLFGEAARIDCRAWDVVSQSEFEAAVACARAAMDESFDADDVPEDFFVDALAANHRYIVRDPLTNALWLVDVLQD
ncbi:MAG: hypothetical protein EOM91_12150 [Sphingobacteriia bacterium]|jgi:hypothetical protein|nr:hypothetical protein [Sphingobacteriia bacterium]